MNIEAQNFGTPADISALEAGAVVMASDETRSMIVLVVKDANEKYGIVLRELRKGQAENVPYAINLDVVPSPKTVLHLKSNFFIEPCNYTSFPIHEFDNDFQRPNGALCLTATDDQVDLGIWVRTDRTFQVLFDLRTGQMKKPGSPSVWIKRWRITWRFDDEVVTLCEFGANGEGAANSAAHA